MPKSMQTQLVSLFNRVRVPWAIRTNPTSDLTQVNAITAEIATLGYTFGPDVRAALALLQDAEVVAFRQDLLPVLREIKGDTRRHVPLFRKFPYNMPDEAQYMRDRITGAFENLFGFTPLAGSVLQCGHVIDDRIFNLAEFGACPICQFALEKQPEEAARHAFRNITPLTVLMLASDDFLREAGKTLLGRNSSLSATEKDLLGQLCREMELELPAKVFRENIPFIYTVARQAVGGLLVGATDVLRIACYVSNPEADLSLKEPTRFKLSNSHRRSMLAMLEGLDGIEEDLMRHRERWLRLGEKLAPGAKENMRRFPKTAAAFHLLRDRPQSIVTFNRIAEVTLRYGVLDVDFLAVLKTRPGEFVRRLDALLRMHAADHDLILTALENSIGKVELKLLFEIDAYFKHRLMHMGDKRCDMPKRVFFPKGSVNKAQMVPDTRAGIDPEVVRRAIEIIERERTMRLALRPAMGAVFLDPALKRVVMPFNRRGDSATSAAIPKGSAFPIPDSDFLRLFVHWTGRDVDLSIMTFDADFNTKGRIAYYQLSGTDMAHSGDIQSAPHGASEFIDIKVSSAKKQGIRYVAMSVISFSGGPFNGFPCFAGFMERDSLKSGKHFEPASVKLKFEINQPTTTAMPLLFDVVERKVVFVDMASGERHHRSVDDTSATLAETAKAILDLPNRKPTVYGLIEANVAARGGTLVDAPEQAELVFKAAEIDLDKVATDFM